MPTQTVRSGAWPRVLPSIFLGSCLIFFLSLSLPSNTGASAPSSTYDECQTGRSAWQRKWADILKIRGRASCRGACGTFLFYFCGETKREIDSPAVPTDEQRVPWFDSARPRSLHTHVQMDERSDISEEVTLLVSWALRRCLQDLDEDDFARRLLCAGHPNRGDDLLRPTARALPQPNGLRVGLIVQPYVWALALSMADVCHRRRARIARCAWVCARAGGMAGKSCAVKL